MSSAMGSTTSAGSVFFPAMMLRMPQSNGSRCVLGSIAAAPGALIGSVMASRRMLPPARRLHDSSWSNLPVRRCRTRAICGSAASNPAAQQQQPVDEATMVDSPRRSLSNFEPSIWGDFFLMYSSPLASSAQQTSMIERADQLKFQVSRKIAASSNYSLHERMHLIDILERLCLDYLFEEEINSVLTQISSADVSGCDLPTAALWFYLLRKHGYLVSPDIFENFRDEQRNFAAKNPRDLLSLYNASYLRTNGEVLLDEAASFTKRCLESVVPHMEGTLAREIRWALEIPLPRHVRIYEAKHYISVYGKQINKGDEVIWELAKLNSNLVQLNHQQELKIITRWWNGLDLESRLSFARDRIVECYFWVVGVYFEPKYSRGRIILTKVLGIVSILDDTYDVYGTSQECELFTKYIERILSSWDPKEAYGLPENMKFILAKILDTCLSIEDELTPEEKYRMSYLKNFIVDLVKAYNEEVKWREQGYVPATVEEHLQVSVRSGACHLLSCASFIGMGDIATKDAFDWVRGVPKIVKALCIILRLSDDLMSYEREQMTSHVASTIDSCMKEHKVPVQVAREKIKEMIEETWKDFNEEWLNHNNRQPRQLLERIFNLTRTMVFMYKQDDAYTNCSVIKDNINNLFVKPISML
ncbi:hypothetical protein ACP4OV_014654 [Aristida adscensionis]